MEIKFFDTKEKKKTVFKPIDLKEIKLYVCGPTVYDRAHIGNARPAVVFDVLFRFLRYNFGKNCVTYVRNFTDIDDKINKQSMDTGRSIKSITDETIKWYKQDMLQLNVLEPSKSPRATEFVGAMIKQISILINNKNAYQDDTGHVLFSTRSFPDYGLLSHRKLDEMNFGSRVAVSDNKRDPLDFILWKPSDEKTPGWDSPWGRGRPGWHIECSAMIHELLGESFDIHGGGIDLVFPHHENEIAQSCCSYPKGGFANIWMHNGFLQIEGEKMAKSSGNFFTVQDLIQMGVNGEVIRMVLMLTHYRQPLDWTRQRVSDASKVLNKWRLLCAGKRASKSPASSVLAALADDLNTPKAFAELHELASAGNYSELLSSAQFLGLMEQDLNEALPTIQLSDFETKKIKSLLRKRFEAKKVKDFVTADQIRKKIERVGIILQDKSDKTEWSLSPNFNRKKMKDL
ncbi:MAG: cysteine--tRNA ligase [Rhodobacteraceae bacterium]|nr:MAG: cysteine--tRNA ligase [Paracoccaceae bacterium]